MKIQQFRFFESKTEILSICNINNDFFCFILESINCIPCGIYKLGLRDVGGHHIKYLNDFPDFHKGMIEIKKVPNRKYILYHIGNYYYDTEGCNLTGDTIFNKIDNNNNEIKAVGNSKSAYIKFYKKVIDSVVNNDATLQIFKFKKGLILGETSRSLVL